MHYLEPVHINLHYSIKMKKTIINNCLISIKLIWIKHLSSSDFDMISVY